MIFYFSVKNLLYKKEESYLVWCWFFHHRSYEGLLSFYKKYYTLCIQMRKRHSLPTILRIFLISRKSFSHNVSFWITDNTPPHINIQVNNNKRKLLPITFDHACFLSNNFGFELLILWRNWKSLVSLPIVLNGKNIT